MSWFQKKTDPLTERARALTAEIAALQTRIQEVEAGLASTASAPAPRLRSTTLPDGHKTVSAPAPAELLLEATEQQSLQAPREPATTAAHYNELGVRKFDLPAAWQRLKRHFGSQPVSNPKLINLLSAGQIRGLRPLRYERRVARNRFIGVFLILLLVLLGLVSLILR